LALRVHGPTVETAVVAHRREHRDLDVLDLLPELCPGLRWCRHGGLLSPERRSPSGLPPHIGHGRESRVAASAPPGALRARLPRRSEEHTSELQSRENLVCRLLLEKK